MVSDRLSSAGYKRLYALSGNECAFPGCPRPVTVEDLGAPVTTSEAAHIVAKSRQGPRGRVEIEDTERRSVLNHVLFCDEHHKIVDANPRVYSVGVLRKMKVDHEARTARTSSAAATPLLMTDEEVRITAMPVIGLPAAVYSAKPLHSDFPSAVRGLRRRQRRDRRSEVIPFVLDDRLWAFHDLSRSDGPFANVVRRSSTTSHAASDLWETDDGHRLYIRLLNQALTLHLQNKGLAWDKKHKRFWFAAADAEPKKVRVPTKTGQNRERVVAFEQRYKSGDGKGIWCHWALEWQFERVGASGWVLALRPAYQWTTDGSTLLDPDLVGKKAAQKMAHLYNAQYFDQVHFWQTWMTEGAPRLVVPVGHATLVLGADAPATNVAWPTIGDDVFRPAVVSEDDLLTFLDYQSAVEIDPDDLYVEEPDPETKPLADDAA